jgi:hypothetical protein
MKLNNLTKNELNDFYCLKALNYSDKEAFEHIEIMREAEKIIQESN